MADNLLYVASGEKTLSASITTSSATVVLSDINSRAGDALTMADFGDIGFATIDPNGINMELISFTGITSTSLTGVTRGLGFEAPYTNVAALQLAHAAGTKVVFSNSPQLYNEFAGKDNNETITQTWTFTNTAIPTLDSYAAPTTNAELASKKYVDDVAAGGTATIDRLVVDATAGETVAAGDLVYHDETDNEWKLTDADTTTTVDNVLMGISQGAGTNGATITGGVLLSGLDSNQSGMTEGDVMFASNTAGEIANSAGTTEVTIGIARNTTKLYFAPRFNQNITEAQQDLIDGITASTTEINQLTGSTITSGQLTEAGTFFGSTDISAAEAETLTDASDADALHTHPTITNQGVGAITGTRIRYTVAWDAINISVTDGAITATGANSFSQFASAGATWEIAAFIPGSNASNRAHFDDAKDYTMELAARAIDGTTDDRRIGFGTGGGFLLDFDSSTNDFVGFGFNTTTTYAVTANAGSASTTTDISSGITMTDWNTYKVVFDGGVNAKFYINGTLLATHTTNLPDGATDVKMGLGGIASGEDWLMTQTILDVEL
jgi:hypothetical protein